MSNTCIDVPSPQEIRDGLFPQGVIKPSCLPPVWTAQALFVPFGGLSASPTVPSDQLVVGRVTYDASSSTERLMRVSLYLFEKFSNTMISYSGRETERHSGGG